MLPKSGKYLKVAPSRRWMVDLVALSRSIPIAALEHRIYIKPVVEARDALQQVRPSWVALFLKAFGIVALRRPYLRQGYFNFPWPRMYEHAGNVVAITVEREWRGEFSIFFDMLPSPERMTLMEIHDHLKRLKTEPVESIPTFNRLIRGNVVPYMFRWMIWWWLYSFSGPRRAKFIGTFAINGGTRFPIRPVMTTGAIGTTFYFGPFHEDGSTDVCLTFDHRVMDGGQVVRALDELESVFNTEILAELMSLKQSGV